jgi:DNA repair protein RecO (recombination protein O)
VILSVRKHGETSAIVELFTRGQGRYLGLVRGGRSRRLRPVLQPGNSVHATWRARLSEHLGTMDVEASKLRVAVIIEDPLRLAGLSTLTTLSQLVAEREAHERLYDASLLVLDAIEADSHWPALLVRWELGLLEELGFGLDLGRCAATGTQDDLVYVSPKSARAVSGSAGEPYADKLLRLPMFLRGLGQVDPTEEDILSGFALTGYFLERHVFEPRGLPKPESRERVISRLARISN